MKFPNQELFVLLVEDSDVFGWAMKNHLEVQGHRVARATGRGAALQLLEVHQIDVLIWDLDQGESGGREFLETARTLRSKLVTVAVSVFPHGKVAAKTAGYNAFWVKPMFADVDELLTGSAIDRV